MDGTYSSPRLYVTALQNIDEQARFSLVQLRRAKSLGEPMILSDIEIRGEQTSAKPCILELTIVQAVEKSIAGRFQ